MESYEGTEYRDVDMDRQIDMICELLVEVCPLPKMSDTNRESIYQKLYNVGYNNSRKLPKAYANILQILGEGGLSL